MTPQEIAMKFASASATCKNGKCPFTAQCRGTTDTCKMKEVAMIIRAIMEELATVRAQNRVLEGMSQELLKYVHDLEVINERYYRLAVSFQNGVRPKAKIKRKKPIRKPRKNPIEMDGDERYAQDEPRKTPPDLPVVII